MIRCSICTAEIGGDDGAMPFASTLLFVVEFNGAIRQFILCPTCGRSTRDHLLRLGERYRDGLTRPE